MHNGSGNKLPARIHATTSRAERETRKKMPNGMECGLGGGGDRGFALVGFFLRRPPQ